MKVAKRTGYQDRDCLQADNGLCKRGRVLQLQVVGDDIGHCRRYAASPEELTIPRSNHRAFSRAAVVRCTNHVAHHEACGQADVFVGGGQHELDCFQGCALGPEGSTPFRAFIVKAVRSFRASSIDVQVPFLASSVKLVYMVLKLAPHASIMRMCVWRVSTWGG